MSDGHIVYQGVANQSPAYFLNIGFEFSRFCNPADAYLKILSIDYPKTQTEIDKIRYLVEFY